MSFHLSEEVSKATEQHLSNCKNKTQLRMFDTIYISMFMAPGKQLLVHCSLTVSTSFYRHGDLSPFCFLLCGIPTEFQVPRVTLSFLKRDILTSLLTQEQNSLFIVLIQYVSSECIKTKAFTPKKKKSIVWVKALYVCLAATAELFLVLPLRCSEEVLQNAPQVLECGPVVRVFPPAQKHNVIQPLWAVFWPRHSVVAL